MPKSSGGSSRGGSNVAVDLSEDPEWADLQPEPVEEDQGKVIAIQYTAAHKQALGYFRAVLSKGERSQRLLRLTQQLIQLNSADYTAWQVRWDTLLALKEDLRQEYELTKEIALDNAKNYQLWNHRRKLAVALGPECAQEEFAFAAEALSLNDDAKNYHAWAHRQFLVAHWGRWQQEWEYVEQLVAADVRNNSAWNQRAWLLQHDPSKAVLPRRQLLAAELEYVAEHLAVAPRNESPWNYLWGLFKLPGTPTWDMGRHREVHIICREALADCPSCAPALDTLAQYYLACACLAAQHLAARYQQQQQHQQRQGDQVEVQQQQQQQQVYPAGGQAAGEQHETRPQQQSKQPATSSHTAAAAAAVEAACSAALQVLQKLLIADGIRAAYWCHRRREVEEVLAACGSFKGGQEVP